MLLKKNLKKHLNDLYPEQSEVLFEEIMQKIYKASSLQNSHPERRQASEQDLLLITYPHQIQAPSTSGKKPLELLSDFYTKELAESFSGIHLLPFFPSTSDGGFAVSSYETVDPAFGDWEDIVHFDCDLMFDAVFNHTSSSHAWFKNWLSGDKDYENFYHYFKDFPEGGTEKRKLFEMVTRPRSSELLAKFQCNSEDVYVWATFGPDQLDVNFTNPKVLMEFVDLLILYIQKGATYLRIDAVPFLWKKLGTNCMHLNETHSLIKVFRSILDFIKPEVILITESNVPHEENISYLDNGIDEAQMVYNFSLAPLVLHAILSESTSYLKKWVSSLSPLEPTNHYFNFTATHDGIGLRPLEGIIEDEEIFGLTEKLKEKGGLISYRSFEGEHKPYEANITWASALHHEDQELHIRRILTSYAMTFVFPGVPGVYFHNLLGSLNWVEGVKQSNHNRDINRKMFTIDELNSLLDKNTFHSQVFRKSLELLKQRRSNSIFHPNAKFTQMESDNRLWILEREYEGKKAHFIFNISKEDVTLENQKIEKIAAYDFWWDFI